jgi:hypothetical protein
MLMKNILLIAFIVFQCTHLHSQVPAVRGFDFRHADSIAARYPKYPLAKLPALANLLTQDLSSDVEKFRAIYKWVCTNIEYDYPTFLTNQQKRRKLKTQEEREQWNKRLNPIVFKKLLNDQRTVCTGYAYLVRELAYHAGLPCVIIDGYGRTAQANIKGPGIANHSWNGVQLSGKWYLCDPTWSSGAYDKDLSAFVAKYDDSYFLTDPYLFIRNHYPLDSTWTLLDSSPTLNEFLNRPLVYSASRKLGVTQLIPETFDVNATQRTPVSFQFAIQENALLETVELQVKAPNKLNSITPQFYKNDSGFYCVDHIFHAKGIHIVHFFLNKNIAFTYTVNVK